MKERSKLWEEFYAKGRVEDCPVYDLHGHMGSFSGAYLPRADADSMIAAMDRAGVRMLVFSSHAALSSPDIGNATAIAAVRRFPGRLRAYCAVNPNYPDIVEAEVAGFDRYRDVYVGFKFLSDYHGIAITDARYEPAWQFADERGLLILLHTWGHSQFDGPEPIRKVAEKYRRVKILLGHSCHGEWQKAIDLANDFPNVYLELTAIPDERGVLEMFVEKAGSQKLLFGTDSPWFNHHYYIGAICGAGITDEDRRNVFCRNAEKLLGCG